MTEIELVAKLDELHTEFLAHVEENKVSHQQISNSIEKHLEEERIVRKVVFGNGGEGLAEQVRALVRFADGARKLLWILIPAFILGAASLIWSSLVFYMRET